METKNNSTTIVGADLLVELIAPIVKRIVDDAVKAERERIAQLFVDGAIDPHNFTTITGPCDVHFKIDVDAIADAIRSGKI